MPTNNTKNERRVSVHFKAKPTSNGMRLIYAVVSAQFSMSKTIDSLVQSITGEPSKFSTGEAIRDYRREANIKVSDRDIYKRVLVYTGLSLPSTFWKDGKATDIYEYYNAILMGWKENIIRLYNSIPNKSNLTPEVLRKKIREHVVGRKGDSGKTLKPLGKRDTPFWEFIQDCITEERKLQLAKEKTLRSYISFTNIFKQYNANISVGELDHGHIELFFVWLRVQKKYVLRKEGNSYEDRKYSAAYLNTFRIIIKKYLMVAIKKKVTDLTVSDLLEIGALRKGRLPDKEIIFLTPQELDKLQATPIVGQTVLVEGKEITLTAAHKAARDLFIVAAWSGGKRFSDYHKMALQPDPDGGYYMTDVSQKTGTVTKVPALKRVIKIWEEYGKTFPAPPSNFNSKLRATVLAAGITKPFSGSHVARRSFCSNMVFYYNMNPFEVMNFSGHKDINSFVKYIGLNKEHLYQTFRKKLQHLGE